MQLLLPIFPRETKLINSTLGLFCKEEIVTYLHCGAPIFSHAEEDIKSFRYITSKFIIEGLCRKIEISNSLGVSYNSVNRYVKKLRELGDQDFFTDNRHGNSYKLTPQVLSRMQKYLDDGKNNCEISRLESVTEGAVRYAIKRGYLKKKHLLQM